MRIDGRVALAVGVAVAIGLGAWGKHVSQIPAAPPAPPIPTVSAPPPPTPVPARMAATSQAPAASELRYRFTDMERAGANEACLVFSGPLQAAGAVRYEDYLSFAPALQPALRVEGARLCLSGLEYGTNYTLTLRAGFPGAEGRRLPENANVELGLGDRPASISFGPGFVLPREAMDGLPVSTVNVEALEVSVYRVGDRLLALMRADMVDEKQVYRYRENELESAQGKLVWRGRQPVQNQRNRQVSTLIPLAPMIGKAESGAYLIVARRVDPRRDAGAVASRDDNDYSESYYAAAAAQWVVSTDIALTSFTGADGLTLVARSLASAKPIEGVRLTLIARNNDELGVATTDAAGVARFDPGLLRGTGGSAPVMAMAYAAGDFNFLDLRRPAFDLSDRGVDGRPPAGQLDAYLYTERGIYRPGETVHLTGLLRDPTAQAVAGRSLTVKFLKPDGGEFRRYTLRDQGAGGGAIAVALPASAHRGSWRATAHADPEGPAIGQVGFDVQDFVPQRLAIDFGEKPAALVPGQAFAIPLNARFLYGAPGADLGVEGDLTVERDPNPYPRYAGYRWGLVDEAVAGEKSQLSALATDAEGRATIAGELPAKLSAGTLPLRAEIAVSVREPGGRATSDRVYLPIRFRDVAIGVRPLAPGGVAEGRQAVFDIVALDAGGAAQEKRLDFRLIRESNSWQWFRAGNSWRYETIKREREIEAGTLTTSAGADPLKFARDLRWGTYVLTLRDAGSGAATSVRFHVGWYGADSAERPDRLELGADRAGYRPGETAKLRVDSDVGGEALLVVANERVHSVRNVVVPAGGGEIDVPIAGEWGPGAYALVTLYRPVDAKLGRNPVRAVGVAWLGLDPQSRSFTVSIDAPQRVTPRRAIDVTLRVAGGEERAFVTLAAVDQGILQLTRFRSPAPQSHYLAKRRLGVGMGDDYGRLIRTQSAQDDDQGGDSFGGRGLDVVPTRTVALFSGVVPVGADGTATVKLDIPDFQGELRLMAAAFGASRVGSAEARLTVRDPVVAETILPRFLAPGDKAEATVLLHNVEGIAGDYRVSLRMKDAVAGGFASRDILLPAGQREVFTVPIEGAQAGIGTVELAVSGPGDFLVTRAWPIQVRPAQLPETRQIAGTLAAGETLTLGNDLLDGFMPGTAEVAVSVARTPGLDVPALLRWLDRYPFGCLEQTTSRAFPLLYFNDVALFAGARRDLSIDARVQEAIDRVLDMQTPEGDFRMWGQWGGSATQWISVFALDFLSRAAERNFDVPQAALVAGRRWLASVAQGRGDRAERDYAAALLAKRGQISAADLRYFHDSATPQSPLALAQLGLALESVGERARAGSAFEQARKALTAGGPKTAPYGSDLRDSYAAAVAMAQAGRANLIPGLLDHVRGLDARVHSTTTQEKAWMLLLAAEFARNAGRLAIEFDGQPAVGTGEPVSRAVSRAELANGLTLRNAGTGDVFRTVSVEGVPREPLPEASAGINLRKRFFALNGTPLDEGAAVARNARVVVVIDGEATRKFEGEYAILDLLPAGLEIETTLRRGQPGFEWLAELSNVHMHEGRDDRYVAAFAMPQFFEIRDPNGNSGRFAEPWKFAFAYVVRAVTPGEFALPAATMEHMYVPSLQARTGMARVTVTP